MGSLLILASCFLIDRLARVRMVSRKTKAILNLSQRLAFILFTLSFACFSEQIIDPGPHEYCKRIEKSKENCQNSSIQSLLLRINGCCHSLFRIHLAQSNLLSQNISYKSRDTGSLIHPQRSQHSEHNLLQQIPL